MARVQCLAPFGAQWLLIQLWTLRPTSDRRKRVLLLSLLWSYLTELRLNMSRLVLSVHVFADRLLGQVLLGHQQDKVASSCEEHWKRVVNDQKENILRWHDIIQWRSEVSSKTTTKLTNKRKEEVFISLTVTIFAQSVSDFSILCASYRVRHKFCNPANR